MTLTHTCHNAFADSCGYLPGIIPLHGGLRYVFVSYMLQSHTLLVLLGSL